MKSTIEMLKSDCSKKEVLQHKKFLNEGRNKNKWRLIETPKKFILTLTTKKGVEKK